MINQFVALFPTNRLLQFILLMLAILPIYFYGVAVQWQLNSTLQRVDQSAYIEYAKGLAEDISYTGDRNRMPLYPFIQSLHYQEGERDRIFFERGKLLNVILATLILVGVSWLFWQWLDTKLAIFAILLNACFVFAYMAPYFQTEILFYSLFFACFLLLGRLLLKPSYPLAMLTGILLGVGHLTKASIMLMLAAFIAVYTLKALIELRQIKPLMRHMLMPLLITVCFVVVIFPYLRQSKTHYGSYLYNVNTTFYIWYDSWQEVEEGTKAAGDREGYPDLPADEIPSLHRYIQEHSLLDMVKRLTGGIGNTFYLHTFRGYGYAKYMLVYAAALAWLALTHRRQTWQFVWQYRWLALYVGLVLAIYVAVFGWYVPISTGRRFLLTLWLPTLLILLWLVQKAKLNWLNTIMLAVLILDIIFIWRIKIGVLLA